MQFHLFIHLFFNALHHCLLNQKLASVVKFFRFEYACKSGRWNPSLLLVNGRCDKTESHGFIFLIWNPGRTAGATEWMNCCQQLGSLLFISGSAHSRCCPWSEERVSALRDPWMSVCRLMNPCPFSFGRSLKDTDVEGGGAIRPLYRKHSGNRRTQKFQTILSTVLVCLSFISVKSNIY